MYNILPFLIRALKAGLLGIFRPFFLLCIENDMLGYVFTQEGETDSLAYNTMD